MTVWSSDSIIPMIVCAAWLISEITLGRLLHSKGDGASGLDRWSLRILWVAIFTAVGVTVAFDLSKKGVVPVGTYLLSVCGFALIIAGLAIRWAAILSLRKYFTSDVSIQSDHRLLTSGIYGVVRHPAYTGTLLSFFGLGLSYASWLSTVVIFIPILFAFLYRIRVEEQALAAHFGDAYTAYARRVKRLLPLIY